MKREPLWASLHLLRRAALAASGRQSYLAFEVGAAAFGIPFSRIAEVRTLANVTPVLQPPDYVAGFVVMHHDRVPVLDLRVDFGVAAPLDGRTRMLVVWRRSTRGGDERLGLLVDRVHDLVQIDAVDVEAPPDFGPELATDFILGCHVERERTRLLLDVDRLAPDLVGPG